MAKMKGKKQEAPLNSEMNSEVIDIPCNFCSKVFCSWNSKDRYRVSYHLLTQHDIPYEQPKQETVYECGLCLYRGLQSQYEKHLLFVYPEFDFAIALCKGEERKVT